MAFTKTRFAIALRYVAASVLLWAAVLAPEASGFPYELTYANRITDADGKPVQGPITVSVDFFWDIADSAVRLNIPAIVKADIPVIDGVFQLAIELPPEDFHTVFSESAATVFVQVTDKTHNRVYAKQQFSVTPYALKVPVDAQVFSYKSNGELTLAATPPTGSGTHLLAWDASGGLNWVPAASSSGSGGMSPMSGVAGGDLSGAYPDPVLTNTGVIAGTYTKLYVDSKGRAQFGANLIAGDVPDLPASKIVSGKLSVAQGGTGVDNLTTNGVLVGNGSSNIFSTAAGSGGQVLRVPSGGGVPGFGALDLASVSAVTGTLSKSFGGTGINSTATFPMSGTIVTQTATETLSNKTLSASVINNATLTGVTAVTGDITMAPSKTLGLGGHSSDPAGLTTADKGKTWFNTTANVVKYWDGISAVALSAAGSLVTDANIAAGAAIADSKLATISTPGKVSGAAITSGTIGGSTELNTSGNISTTGNVGIGTAAANSKLQVQGGVAVGYSSTFAAPSDGMIVAGNVGIGTTSPAAQLSVGSASQFQISTSGDISKINGVQYKWPSAQATSANQVLTNNGSGSLSWTTAGGGSSQWTTSGSNVYYSSGNVGIGTTAPVRTLHVYATSSATRMQRDTNGGWAAVDFVPAATLSAANPMFGMGLQPNSQNLTIWTSPDNSNYNTRVTLDTSGNVGIGTTAPAGRLDVAGSICLNGANCIASWPAGSVTSVSANAPISVSNNSSTPAFSITQANGSTNGYLSSSDWSTFNAKQAAGNYVTLLYGDVTSTGFASGSVTTTLASVALAGTATKVTFDVKGRVTSGTSLSASDIPPISAATITSGTLNVANGGTGATSLAANNVILGNGTSPVQVVAPGTSGNVLTSNGTTWQSTALPATTWATPGTIGSTTPNTGAFTSITSNTQAGYEAKPFGATAGNTGEMRFDELAANGINYVGFKAPDLLAANKIWVLPATDGTAGQVLKTDGAGNLSWVSATGSVTSVGITAGSAGLTVTGGPITSSGNMTVALANDLAAVEGLANTGGVERTGTDTWGTYTLTAAGKALLDDADATAQRNTLGLGTLATASAVSGGINGALTDGTIIDADISSSAAIADSKLATISTAGKVSGTAITSGNIVTSGNFSTTGNVGIGTTNAAVSLEVNGAIRAGSETVVTACNGTLEGSQRYNRSTHNLEFCNGSDWISLTKQFRKQIFTSTASGQTFSVPNGVTGDTVFKLTVVGGGGGGTGNGGGGGGGGAAIKWITTPSGTCTISVGAGGAAGSNGSSSSVSCTVNGTSMSVTANGGTGGSQFYGRPGGTATGGDLINFTGGGGGPYATEGGGGTGGNSIFGGGGDGGKTIPGVAGGAPGAGGGGGGTSSGTGQSGGAGANGIVIIEWVQ